MGKRLEKILEKTKTSGQMFSAGFGTSIDMLSGAGELAYKLATEGLDFDDKPENLHTISVKSVCKTYREPTPEVLDESLASVFVTRTVPFFAGALAGTLINGSTMFIPAYILATLQGGREAKRLYGKIESSEPIGKAYDVGSG